MTLAAVGIPWVDRMLGDLPSAFAFLLAVIILVSAVGALVLGLLARRSRSRESREVVRLLEEMRAGRPKARIDLDSRSPYAAIAESANRLGQDLAVRWTRGEAAHEGFEALQEAARGYAVVATDGDGDLRSFSPGAVQMFGWDEDSVVARNASLLFDETSWKDLLPKLARKNLRERGVEARALMARKDGTRFHARVHVRLLRGHGDDPAGFLLVVQDVSEQVRVESELKRQEARSRGIVDGLPDGVAIVQRGRILFSNAALRQLLDLDERDAAGALLLDRIGTGDVLLVQDALSGLEAGRDRSFEASVALRDAAGHVLGDARVAAVRHEHDGQPAVLVTLRDETSMRRVIRGLAAQEARLDIALDAWDEGVLLVEDEPAGTHVRLANRAFLEAFGLARADVAGATESELMRLLYASGEAGASAATCLAKATREPVHELALSGDRALTLRAQPFGPPGEASRGRLLSVRDATAEASALRDRTEDAQRWRRRHEATEASFAKLRELHDDLEARRVEAERLNQELRTLDTMKSDLLANVSHELQTPLVSIRGYTEMISKGRLGPINDEQKQGLSLSLRNIDRLIAMIDNLLAFARMDREAGALAVQPFPLDAVVDEAVALLRERMSARGIRFSRRLAEPAPIVRADRDKILQVFVNLLSNAVKFNRDGGAIEIDARPGKPGFLLIQVKDTGVGIAKDDLEKIFDRFYQVDEGDTRREGTGIGLAIVRNILRSHGCVIHAASKEGEGTTFSFTLPIAGEARQAQDPRPAESVASSPAPEPPEPAPPVERPAAAPPAADEPGRPRLRIIRRG